MLTEVVAASDRNGSRAREWAMCVMDDSISHEQLARVPPGFEKLDRNFTKALKKVLQGKLRGAQAGRPGGNMRMTMGSQQPALTSLQILRMLYVSLSTSVGYCKQHAIMDLNRARWLGDGPVMRTYITMMEDMFAEIGGFSDTMKRELVSEHMRASADPNILSDLAHFDRAGDTFPRGRSIRLISCGVRFTAVPSGRSA